MNTYTNADISKRQHVLTKNSKTVAPLAVAIADILINATNIKKENSL